MAEAMKNMYNENRFANEKKPYIEKHSFADVSVRKHYPGRHSITLIVNGVDRGTLDFKLRTN